ncbi:MAG: hypothetical protein JWM16_3115 [Verrucomicrobiales bacterium]|nr:hypothetical protein [Verrucomicrobiales bacterium]
MGEGRSTEVVGPVNGSRLGDVRTTQETVRSANGLARPGLLAEWANRESDSWISEWLDERAEQQSASLRRQLRRRAHPWGERANVGK